MANNVWDNSDADGNGDNANNWSLGRVPIAGDTAYFDGTSATTCTFSAGPYTFDGLVTVAAYNAGTVALNGRTFNLGTVGMVLDNTGTSAVTCGAATIEITAGPLDNQHSQNWLKGTSTFVTKETCTIVGPGVGMGKDYYDLTISTGTATVTTWTLEVAHLFTVSAALVSTKSVMILSGGDLVINAGATFSGATNIITLMTPTSGHGLITLDAIAPAISVINPAVGSVLAAGTYAGLVKVSSTAGARILSLNLGTYIFNNGLELENAGTGSIALANDTNGPTITVTNLTIDLDSTGGITINDSGQAVNWTITGNVVDERTGAGTFTWTKGTGTITFSGAADQNVDLMDQTVEDVVINKSAGNFVLSGGFTTDSFTGTSTGTGDFDPVGQTITVTGDCSWAAAFVFDSAADCLNGCGWDIGGNFTADGQTLNATAVWVLEVTGTAVASGAGAVAWSDASTGTEIDASAGPWTDNLNNTNWNFGAAGLSIPIAMRHYLQMAGAG